MAAQASGLLGRSPFSIERAYVQRRSGVTAPVGGVTPNGFWVLARSLVRVRSIQLPALDARKMAGAIQVELMAWRPFENCAYYVIPQPRGAVAYAWDSDLVNSAIESTVGTNLESVRVVPEPALRAEPFADGLFRCLEGIEAVYVDRGAVAGSAAATATAQGSGTTYSQWWPDSPSLSEWQNFVRISGFSWSEDASNRIPAVAPLPGWRKTPVGSGASQARGPDRQQEWLAVALVAFLLALPTVWLANDWRQLALLRSDAASRLESTERELNGLLQTRSTAFDAKARSDALAKLFVVPDVSLVTAQVAETLNSLAAPGKFQLTDWEWRDRKVRFSMQMDQGVAAPPVTQLVRAFESIAAYSDVKINADGGRVNIEFTVLRNSTASKP